MTIPKLLPILPILASLALSAGCTATVAYPEASGPPDLVEVDAGVRVIPDYDEAIFFADGFYWWSVDGAWYRSPSYTGGWVYWSTPPVGILRIREPWRFRHHHPPTYVAHRRPVPAHAIRPPVHRGPTVRDHRH